MCLTWKPQVSPGCHGLGNTDPERKGLSQEGTEEERRQERAGEGESSAGPMGRLEEGRRARAGRESVEGKGVEEVEGQEGKEGEALLSPSQSDIFRGDERQTIMGGQVQGQSGSRCKLSSWEGNCLLEKLKSREFITIGD